MRHHRAVPADRPSRSLGVALVEFALLLPLMSILVFGVVDVGRALTAWNEAKGAAGAAADYASTSPYRQQSGAGCQDPDNAAFRGRAEGGNDFRFEFAPVLPCRSGSLTETERNAVIDRKMTVTAVQDFEPMTPMMKGLLGPMQIRASVTVGLGR